MGSASVLPLDCVQNLTLGHLEKCAMVEIFIFKL